MHEPATTTGEQARTRGGVLRWPMAALEGIARRLFLALIRLYFPRRTIDGTDRLPPAGAPAIYLANHPNGLLDPLVLCVAVERPVRFLAKSTLFGNPAGRLAMNALGCLPVFRPRDLPPDEREQAGPRNEATFAACRRILAAGGELALFPEGTSHSDPRLRPLKTGAARIALSTVAETGVVPVLVPCGLHYEDPARFRSAVHVTVGPAIPVPGPATGVADDHAAVDTLTADIRAGLDAVVLQAETRELLEGVARVASWTDAAGQDAPARRLARTRSMLDAYARLAAADPVGLERVAQGARRYARTLRRLGVADPWSIELPRVTAPRALGTLARALVLAPLAVVGFAASYLPYRLAGVVAGRVTRDEDVLGTVKLIGGSTFLALAWVIEAGVCAWRWGWTIGGIVLLASPALAYAALRFGEEILDLGEAVRHAGWRLRPAARARMAERRRGLADEVEALLGKVTAGAGGAASAADGESASGSDASGAKGPA